MKYIKEELEILSIEYLNTHKQQFLEEYTKDIVIVDDKLAIFTAGMSGVGKTEFATYLKEKNTNLLHIDTDEIRKFFREVGYDGQNSDAFQKVASRGFNELFNFSIKNGYSLILDSNLASISQAVQNIERLVKRGYNIQIYYLYNDPKVCFTYATTREVVTRRKVPKDVFVKSNTNSYRTIIEIKSIFNEKVRLNFFDKRDNTFYKDISAEFLSTAIGEYFDI
jgi:predicted ABC-type ATPase